MAKYDRYGEPIEEPTPSPFLRKDNPLRVRCPWCRAMIGRPCVIPSTGLVLKASRAHPSRAEALQQARSTNDH